MKMATPWVLSSVLAGVLGYTAQSMGATPAQHLWLEYSDPNVKAVVGGSGLSGPNGEYRMPYHVELPANYDPNGPALPVILYLHGAGERGTDNQAPFWNVSGNITGTTLAATGSQRAIVIIPQCPPGQVWNSINNGDNWGILDGRGISSYSETPAQQAARPISKPLQVAMNILANVQASYKVDTKKTYVTGLSMGGFGTWDAITRFPNTFAAAMPLSGGGNVLAASVLANKPIWDFHGTLDTTVFPNGSTNVLNAIKAAGGTKTIYTARTLGHEGWSDFYASGTYRVNDAYTTGGTPTYNGATIYDWLFAQSLPVPEPASITLLLAGGVSLLCRRVNKRS